MGKKESTKKFIEGVAEEGKRQIDERVSNSLDGLVLWPKLEEVDGETQQLVYLVEVAWAWQWPSWTWVADRLNSEYKNSRTAQACRAKYNRTNAKIMAKLKTENDRINRPEKAKETT